MRNQDEHEFAANCSELQRILAAQPLERMRQFASMLGWNGLRLGRIRLSKSEASSARIPSGVVIYYITTDEKFNLQINTQHGQTRLHSATVKADRYEILHVGWHEFELPDDDETLCLLVARLKPVLFRANFKDRKWRKQFATQHPTLVARNRKGRRYRGLPPHYDPRDE